MAELWEFGVRLHPRESAEESRQLPVSFRNYNQRSDAMPFPYLTVLDILWHIVLRSCCRPPETRSQQGLMVHPMRIRGHEHLRLVTYCHECITVLYIVPKILAILSKVTASLLLLGGETHGGTPRRMANSVDKLRMSSPGGWILY